MSMRSSILFLISLPILFSCSGEEELIDSSTNSESIPAGISWVSFNSDPPSQCVYIFRKEGSIFRYDSMIDKEWSKDGKTKVRLQVGDYKFLFTGPLNGQINMLPASLDKTVTFEQLRFSARTDTEHAKGLLPVEELFLPEPKVADSIYTIRGGDEIKCKLKRRVSQLMFTLNRGYKEADKYVPLPYDGKHNILEAVKELSIKISGVASECNYRQTSGEGTIYQTYEAADRESITPEGFATFTGPFVFPRTDTQDVKLTVTVIPVAGQPYPPIELSGKLETNRKLLVNLWLNSSYFDIGVTINTLPISDRTEGDAGIWK